MVGVRNPAMILRSVVRPSYKNIPYKKIVESLRKTYDQANVVASSRAGVLHPAIQVEHAGHVLFYLNLAEGNGGQIFDRGRPFVGGIIWRAILVPSFLKPARGRAYPASPNIWISAAMRRAILSR